MIGFFQQERNELGYYARQTWQVMQGRYALTKIRSLQYEVTISPERVTIVHAYGHRETMGTVKFKAFTEMFRS